MARVCVQQTNDRCHILCFSIWIVSGDRRVRVAVGYSISVHCKGALGKTFDDGVHRSGQSPRGQVGQECLSKRKFSCKRRIVSLPSQCVSDALRDCNLNPVDRLLALDAGPRMPGLDDPLVVNVVAGGLAGAATAVFVCPLDVLKTRMQVQTIKAGEPRYNLKSEAS